MRDLALAVKNQLELLRDELRAEQPNLTDGTFEQLAASYLRTLDQFEQLLRSDDSLLFEFRDDLLDATAEIRDLVDVRKSLVGARMQRLEHGIPPHVTPSTKPAVHPGTFHWPGKDMPGPVGAVQAPRRQIAHRVLPRARRARVTA